MSATIVFNQVGRSRTYLPENQNITKREILDKLSRESFSTANSWPKQSPTAGRYDIANSNTKLILLNNNKKWSHFRGKTKERKEEIGKDDNYEWVEREERKSKMKKANKSAGRSKTATVRSIDPTRHLTPRHCSFKVEYDDTLMLPLDMNKHNKMTSNKTTSRQFSAMTKSRLDQVSEDEWVAYLKAMGKRTVGLQGKVEKPPTNFPNEYKSSYNLNHPKFDKNQLYYLHELYNSYTVGQMKQLKQLQYERLLKQQKDVDKHYKKRFRMHDGQNFFLYDHYLSKPRTVPRTLNTGHFSLKTATNSRRSSSKSACSSSNNNKTKSHTITTAELYDVNNLSERSKPSPKLKSNLDLSSNKMTKSASGENSADQNESNLLDGAPFYSHQHNKATILTTKSNPRALSSSSSSSSSRSVSASSQVLLQAPIQLEKITTIKISHSNSTSNSRLSRRDEQKNSNEAGAAGRRILSGSSSSSSSREATTPRRSPQELTKQLAPILKSYTSIMHEGGDRTSNKSSSSSIKNSRKTNQPMLPPPPDYTMATSTAATTTTRKARLSSSSSSSSSREATPERSNNMMLQNADKLSIRSSISRGSAKGQSSVKPTTKIDINYTSSSTINNKKDRESKQSGRLSRSSKTSRSSRISKVKSEPISSSSSSSRSASPNAHVAQLKKSSISSMTSSSSAASRHHHQVTATTLRPKTGIIKTKLTSTSYTASPTGSSRVSEGIAKIDLKHSSDSMDELVKLYGKK